MKQPVRFTWKTAIKMQMVMSVCYVKDGSVEVGSVEVGSTDSRNKLQLYCHLPGIISVCGPKDIAISFLNIPLIYIRNPLSYDAYIVLLKSKVVFFSFSVLIIILH